MYHQDEICKKMCSKSTGVENDNHIGSPENCTLLRQDHIEMENLAPHSGIDLFGSAEN